MSADNAVPERHIVIETIRNAAPRLGLTASVIATLDAMLSCLPPKRGHHTVFASNATLTFRRNGMSDRSIRRHAAILQDAGLLARRDSPNGKRFTRHNTSEGKALRFGFDLSPLFDRLQEIAALAAEVTHEKEQIKYLKAKMRTAANDILQNYPEDQHALTARQALRRKLTLADCKTMLANLNPSPLPAEGPGDSITPETEKTSGNDGQNVRHHQKSNKEYIDKDEINERQAPQNSHHISLTELLTTCTEASQYALRKIETVDDVITHARTLAPMIGINRQTYEAAQDRLGPLGTATTVWALMQFHGRIKQVGAYFRSITSGSKSVTFDPTRLVRRLTLYQEAQS
ncbi:hypothetical protein P775_02815 [Puniceibacterium antarcticum]|uniref:Uncharacterized protein n=1 Tax=Puniceibacterium antarcticum TaxID=1206336 RepID=A0A2G8RJF5_9RHOB|nr:hypothetical protein P775_02815 [Puniceibacterium antarcticum]